MSDDEDDMEDEINAETARLRAEVEKLRADLKAEEARSEMHNEARKVLKADLAAANKVVDDQRRVVASVRDMLEDSTYGKAAALALCLEALKRWGAILAGRNP